MLNQWCCNDPLTLALSHEGRGKQKIGFAIF
jgi:hypothetical protein